MFVLEHHDEFVGHVSGLVGSMATEFSFSVNSAEVAAPAPANGIPIVALANTAPPTTDEDADHLGTNGSLVALTFAQSRCYVTLLQKL